MSAPDSPTLGNTKPEPRGRRGNPRISRLARNHRARADRDPVHRGDHRAPAPPNSGNQPAGRAGELEQRGGAEAEGKTAECRSVRDAYFRFIREFGNEHRILTEVPVADLCALGPEKVGRGVERMRKGLVRIAPGHDGEYGRIRLLDPEEEKLGSRARKLSSF